MSGDDDKLKFDVASDNLVRTPAFSIFYALNQAIPNPMTPSVIDIFSIRSSCSHDS